MLLVQLFSHIAIIQLMRAQGALDHHCHRGTSGRSVLHRRDRDMSETSNVARCRMALAGNLSMTDAIGQHTVEQIVIQNCSGAI